MIEFYEMLMHQYRIEMYSSDFIKLLQPYTSKIFLSKENDLFYIDANSIIYFCVLTKLGSNNIKCFKILDYSTAIIYMPLPAINNIDDMILYKDNVKSLYDANESIKDYFNNKIFE